MFEFGELKSDSVSQQFLNKRALPRKVKNHDCLSFLKHGSSIAEPILAMQEVAWWLWIGCGKWALEHAMVGLVKFHASFVTFCFKTMIFL